MKPFYFIVTYNLLPLTSGAERAIIGGGGAVTQVPVVPLHTLSSVPAVHPITGTVALATRLNSRGDLGSLFQVEGDAVHPQASDTAQEPPLAPCRT